MQFLIRVKPGAKHIAVGGSWSDGQRSALVVSVRAAAVAGKANKAVRAALAAALGVKVHNVLIVQGEKSQHKLIELSNPPANAAKLVADLLQQQVTLG